MLLANEKNIREVTLFPMNQNAQDLMMKAPSNVDDKQLKELSIKKDLKKINSWTLSLNVYHLNQLTFLRSCFLRNL